MSLPDTAITARNTAPVIVILFMILGCLLMVLVAVVMNHPELTKGLM